MQEQANEDQPEMKIALPSMPSLYIASFLFQACKEIHRVGGHVVDKFILQKFSLRLQEKVVDMYKDFLSTLESHKPQVSEKGVLQMLLDLRFTADILSGGDLNMNEESSKTLKSKVSFRGKMKANQPNSIIRERAMGLINHLFQMLDSIDWLTAPALSSRGTSKSSLPMASDDYSSQSSWKTISNGELSPKLDFDGNSSFGVAAPFLKSFMQVGSRFGEHVQTGFMLADGQVGRLKDRSAAAMLTFGDILPVQAAGLLSSFTAGRSDP